MVQHDENCMNVVHNRFEKLVERINYYSRNELIEYVFCYSLPLSYIQFAKSFQICERHKNQMNDILGENEIRL